MMSEQPKMLGRRSLLRMAGGGLLVAPTLSAVGLGPLCMPQASAAAGSSVLSAGQTLWPNQFLVSPDGRYRLWMQGDGNLVLVGPDGTPLWAANTVGPNRRLEMQTDGHAVVYEGSTSRWVSNTAGFGESTYLVVQDDGNLCMYAQGLPVWSRYHGGYTGHVLFPNATLNPGAMRRSPGGRSRLVMQGDGNLVQVDAGGKPVWATGTNGPNRRLIMQGDGNIVIYEGSAARWASNSAGRQGARLIVQDDLNLVAYLGNSAVWQRGQGFNGQGGSHLGGGGGTPSGATSRQAGARMPSNLGERGYCTWGALELWRQNTGYYFKVNGNAIAWDESAAANGWSVVAGPEARSVFVKNAGRYGHVGWVRGVEQRADGAYIHTTEMNGGSTWTNESAAQTNEFNRFVDHVRKVTSEYRFILAP